MKKYIYTLTYLMLYNFLDVQKIMDYDNIICFIAPNQNFHPLSLFKYKRIKKQNFQCCSTNNLDHFMKVFHINK
jgi:hypothetical protein